MKLFNKKDEIEEVETIVDEEGNVVEVKKEESKFKGFMKKNWKKLAIGGGIIAAVATGIAVSRSKKHEDEDESDEDYAEDSYVYYEDDAKSDESDSESNSEETTEE